MFFSFDKMGKADEQLWFFLGVSSIESCACLKDSEKPLLPLSV